MSEKTLGFARSVPETGLRDAGVRSGSTSQLPLLFSNSSSPQTAVGTEAPDAPPSGSAKTPGGARPPPYVHRRLRLAKVAVPAPQPPPPLYGPSRRPRKGPWGCPGAGARGTHLPTAQAFAAATAAAAAGLSALSFLPNTHSPSDVAGPACCPLPPHSHITPLTRPGAAASQGAAGIDTHLAHQ